jgi:hypothetical protein
VVEILEIEASQRSVSEQLGSLQLLEIAGK